jgi:hypothetical protein
MFMMIEDFRILQDCNMITKGKYLLSGMFRRDASTKFGPEISRLLSIDFYAGWVVSDEVFGESSTINFID